MDGIFLSKTVDITVDITVGITVIIIMIRFILSEKCSQSRVFISQCHIIHIVQYYAYWLVLFM